MSTGARFFVEELRERLVQAAAVAKRAEADARDAAKNVATESEKKEDGRAALEFGSLATGHQHRAREVSEQVQTLDGMLARGLATYDATSAVGLAAIVDVATEDKHGAIERTFLMLPVGAGTELEGPGGDGFLTVVTPASPVGKALMGKRRGDVTDVTIKGEIYEWTVLSVG